MFLLAVALQWVEVFPLARSFASAAWLVNSECLWEEAAEVVSERLLAKLGVVRLGFELCVVRYTLKQAKS